MSSMNTLFLPSPLFLPSNFHRSLSFNQLKSPYPCSERYCYHHVSLSHSIVSRHSLSARRSSIAAASTTPSNEGVVSVINFEDLMEKDWSFLESDDTNSVEEHGRKIDRIISSGEIGETSRVLVAIGSEEFVDRVVEKTSKSNLLLVVHDSLFVLAGIKEKYDKVKCWQGELIYIPDKWTPLDVVFLYFLPALPFELDLVFQALAKRCSPGAKLVISHPQGREVIEQQRQQYPDVVVSYLPDKMALEKVAADHSFELSEYVDEPGFYLAVLKFSKAENTTK